MRAVDALEVLRLRKRAACLMVTRGGRTHLRCLHCGAEADEPSGQPAETRYREHVRSTCPTTRQESE